MMKTKKIVLAFIIALLPLFVYAQKLEVNTEKSNIEWLGKKIGGQHEGTIRIKHGQFELKNDKMVAGSFVIDMTTITNTDIEDENYNQKITDHLKSDDFFGVKKFPTAGFTITQSTKFNKGKATVTGDITIKGKTESISFDVVRANNEYSANIEIDRSKFDVRYGSDSFFDNLGDKAIDDIFLLDIKLMVL